MKYSNTTIFPDIDNNKLNINKSNQPNIRVIRTKTINNNISKVSKYNCKSSQSDISMSLTKSINNNLIYNISNNKLSKDNNKSSLFNKKTNIVISKSSKYIDSDTGKTRHFTPAAQEWYNSIYTYNANYIKNLPNADKNLMSLLKSYFNGQLNKEFLKRKFKPMQRRYKRLSTKKTFVGKGHLKHTNNKVIITFFIYNTEGMFLASLYKAMNVVVNFPKKKLKWRLEWEDEKKEYIIMTFNRWFTWKEYIRDKNHKFWYLRDYNHKFWYYSYITSLIEGFNSKLEKIDGYFSKITDFVTKTDKVSDLVNENDDKDVYKVLTLEDKFELFSALVKQEKDFNVNINYPFYHDYEIKSIKHYISNYTINGLLLKLNKIKFNDLFLSKLIYLVKKIYKKKIEFNIVNLKKLHLNSDIYTQAVSLKLRNKNNRLYKILKASLRKVKLPSIKRINEKQNKPYKNEFLVNNIRNNIISFMFKDDISDPLNNLLLYFYPSADNIIVKKYSALDWTRDEDNKGDVKGLRSISLAKYLRNWLKHMILRGIRVEAKGRLTRRATASRSVFKMKLKGGLKNVDSSFKGLSTIMLRGHAKSNVQYSLINSKNRNGAFGIKGWVSSK